MSYRGNFTRATLVRDDADTGGDALIIEGTSPEDPEDAREIYVAVPHAGELLWTRVQDATGATDWSAALAQGDPPFEEGAPVIAVGMAILSSTPQPFFWAERLATTARTDPP